MLAHQIYLNEDSSTKLESMGLVVEDFIFAVSRAIYESRRSSPLHPRTSAMSRAWDELVAAFRESVLTGSRGWNFILNNGLEYTINSALGLSIIVTSGNKDTGLQEGFPKTKNTKGVATENMVSRNLDLFESNDINSMAPDMRVDTTQTYVFLYYFDHHAQEVRCELSLPSGMSGFNGYNKIAAWRERIILPSIPFTAAVNTKEKEFNDEIDIVVSRK